MALVPHRPQSTRVIAGLAIAGLLLAACGGDDDDDAATTATAEASDTAAAATTAAPETTAAASSDTASAASSSDTATASTEAPSSDTASETASASSSSVAGGDLAAIEAQVDALLTGGVELPAPTEPVEPGEHDVAVIAAGMASTGPATVANAIQEAVTLIGWTAGDTFDGKFVPTDQATGISQAVADGADVIFLVAITPSAVSAAVAEAQAASIPIVCVLCGPDPITEGIYNVQGDAVAAGEAQGAYVTAMSGGEGTIVLYHNEEFQFSAQQGDATEAYLAENCPGCTVEVRDVLLGEAREANAPVHTQLLSDYAEGELDFVIHPFDSPSAALATTASQLGRTDFGVVGYGALSPFVDMIGAGEPPVAAASVTISSPYYGWSAVDIAARVLAGAELWDADGMPVAMITNENFASYPAGQPYLFPDFEFAEYFGQLWGK